MALSYFKSGIYYSSKFIKFSLKFTLSIIILHKVVLYTNNDFAKNYTFYLLNSIENKKRKEFLNRILIKTFLYPKLSIDLEKLKEKFKVKLNGIEFDIPFGIGCNYVFTNNYVIF